MSANNQDSLLLATLRYFFSNPYLITVFWTTDGQFGAIWTPGKKGDSLVILVMPLQTSGKFELKGFRVKVKNVDMFIFAARGQFEAVWREPAEPDLKPD